MQKYSVTMDLLPWNSVMLGMREMAKGYSDAETCFCLILSKQDTPSTR